jgi:LDH2 family malate/lactate/ureidoglycolate dehydrogenase
MMAIDIARFQPVDVFKARLQGMMQRLREQEAAEGIDHVRVAGDPEKEAALRTAREGLTLSGADLEALRRIAHKLKARVPPQLEQLD